MHLWIMKGLNIAFLHLPLGYAQNGDGHALNTLVSLTLEHALFVFNAGPKDQKYKHLFSFP